MTEILPREPGQDGHQGEDVAPQPQPAGAGLAVPDFDIDQLLNHTALVFFLSGEHIVKLF